MTWINEALEGARGAGCAKCLVGRNDILSDPAFACDACHGTGVPHYQALSATEQLLDACREALLWYGPDGDHIGDPARPLLIAAIAKADGR